MKSKRYDEVLRRAPYGRSACFRAARRHVARAAVWLMKLSCILYAGAVQADCTWANGQSTHNYSFNIPAITVPRDAAVGTVIYTPPYQTAIPSSGVYANCSGNTPVVRKVTGGAQTSANPYTFATNVPGIGMRFFDTDGQNFFRYYGAGAMEYGNGGWGFNGMKFGVQVVVTGQTAGGTIDGTLFATMSLGSLTIANLRTTTAAVTASACNATATSTVTLPDIGSAALPTVGSTAGSTPVVITLTGCPQGMTQIQYQLDPPDGAINAAMGTFAVSHDSTAQGIGLSVTDSTQAPVSLGAPHVVSAYSPQTGGTYPINLAVRYYRTGTVTPGTVNGSLIYTMFYQ